MVIPSIGGGIYALSTAPVTSGTLVDAVRIDARGYVGILNSTPTEALHVVGDALITGDSHADAFKPAVSGNPIKFKNFGSSTEFARFTDGRKPTYWNNN